MRILLGAAAAAALTLGPANANEYALARARALYGQLQDEAQCEAALPAAREFWRSSDFGTLEAQAQAALLYQIMRCAWSLEDGQAAIAASRAARELGAAWPDYALMQLGIRFDDDALAVESFHALNARDAATVKALPARLVWGVVNAADRLDRSGAASLRVHDALAARNYVFPEGVPDDALRVDHARLLAAAGQAARARERLQTVIEPRQIMLVRIDRRFDALRGDADFERRLDVAAGAEAALARAHAAAEAGPRKLALVLDEAQALRTLGRTEQALALLDRHIAAAQASAQNYEDVSEQLNWLLNERAYALYDLNRPVEARAAFGLSIGAGENGQWSVSQVINFASMLSAEGRPADALEVLRTVGRASPYGDMWVAATRACAAAQLGHAAMQAQAMAFLREHTDDNFAAMARAFLCVNDLDGAAALYVRRLNDPQERGEALLALQSYRRPPNRSLPHEALLLERLAQVRARADVRAAVEAVGRIEEVPLYSVYWGDV